MAHCNQKPRYPIREHAINAKAATLILRGVIATGQPPAQPQTIRPAPQHIVRLSGNSNMNITSNPINVNGNGNHGGKATGMSAATSQGGAAEKDKSSTRKAQKKPANSEANNQDSEAMRPPPKKIQRK
ncbi:hypothetical protein B0H67DRAFT_568422 [Lasiosphaeris hirsuta]|uniref:Uncharacterized protein n=1 Tax=Lasiosphaeris hirsuta TaxID=260670 RepID=A0AA40AZ40_9PEZI|nr:hypothetical protein B0H67DRAFT_568422 [Lasiosphaeris hirsuta]